MYIDYGADSILSCFLRPGPESESHWEGGEESWWHLNCEDGKKHFWWCQSVMDKGTMLVLRRWFLDLIQTSLILFTCSIVYIYIYIWQFYDISSVYEITTVQRNEPLLRSYFSDLTTLTQSLIPMAILQTMTESFPCFNLSIVVMSHWLCIFSWLPLMDNGPKTFNGDSNTFVYL